MGIAHDDALVFKDEAVSGAGPMGPECSRLMDMIKKGLIHTVAVDDLSRVSRRADIPMIWDRCMAHGCRIISVIDNIDSETEPDGAQAWIRGLINKIGNRAHGQRCRRSLVGRALDPTGADGSHPFDYSTRYCDPEEAMRYDEGPRRLRLSRSSYPPEDEAHFEDVPLEEAPALPGAAPFPDALCRFAARADWRMKPRRHRRRSASSHS